MMVREDEEQSLEFVMGERVKKKEAPVLSLAGAGSLSFSLHARESISGGDGTPEKEEEEGRPIE